MKLGTLSDESRLDWLRLSQSENVGPITFEKLIARFGTATAAISGLPGLSARGGLKRPLRLYDKTRAETDVARAIEMGARFIASCEPDYPECLRNIATAPPVICVMGDTALAQRPVIAMVGARTASAVGMRFTRTLAREFGEQGFAIASGLARGIDTAAHEAALETGTIAVVAGGIDHVYPPENARLQSAIAEKGLLISEHVPGTVPKAEHFPRRNRVISGLSQATVIVEAALRSGSLITARFANEQGREVFAVPGSPLDPRCEGTNRLIKDGAHMLTGAQDVFDVLGRGQSQQPAYFRENAPEAFSHDFTSADRDHVLALLSPTPIAVDDIIRESNLAADQVMGIILEFEIAGKILRQPGGRIGLNSGA